MNIIMIKDHKYNIDGKMEEFKKDEVYEIADGSGKSMIKSGHAKEASFIKEVEEPEDKPVLPEMTKGAKELIDEYQIDALKAFGMDKKINTAEVKEHISQYKLEPKSKA